MKTSYKYIFLLVVFVGLGVLPACQANDEVQHATSSSYIAEDSIPLLTTSHFHKDNPYYSRTDTSKLHVSKAEWKEILLPDVYHVAFERGTERSFQNKYWDFTGTGIYYCAVCGNKLFYSTAKFSSTCGWPSFFEPARENAIIYREDNRLGRSRTEVICSRCNAHLGHVFHDGPLPTGLRYCMNSIVLDFVSDRTSSPQK